MYELKLIQSIIRKYIDQGVGNFVIYPYGNNGVNVKEVLKDYFNLKPCFIVDNEYHKYNSNIINFDMLRDLYEEKMYIILTIESKDLNSEMLKKLSEFVPLNHIININEIKEVEQKRCSEQSIREKNYSGKGFMLYDFLPSLKAMRDNGRQTGKIKVRIAHSSVNNWNAISWICQAFLQDSSFQLLLVISAYNFREQAIRQAKEIGCDFVISEEYQIEIDLPDILILTNIGDKIVSDGISCRAYAKMIVVACMQLVRYNHESIIQFWQFIEKEYGRHRPDYYLFDTLLYKELKQSSFDSEKIIEMGNAKLDGIYLAVQDRSCPVQWNKLVGKPTVLWATSHGVYDKLVTSNITFDLYAKTIFEYLDQHQDIGLIFRPHSVFIVEMLTLGFWSKDDIQELKIYCDNTPNVVFDDTDTYNTALSIADGILTDAYCGIICSALPTLKPICAAYRSPGQSPTYRKLLDVCYSAYQETDIISFLDMIRNKQDPMLSLREKGSREFVKHFDGKNGYRIKEFIKAKYFENER